MQANRSVRATRAQGPHAAGISARRIARAAPRVRLLSSCLDAANVVYTDSQTTPQVNAAAVETQVDWASLAKDLDSKSPLEIMDHVSYFV